MIRILVFRDMLSISTPDINFRILPNFTASNDTITEEMSTFQNLL